jgi:hypothetical protein
MRSHRASIFARSASTRSREHNVERRFAEQQTQQAAAR